MHPSSFKLFPTNYMSRLSFIYHATVQLPRLVKSIWGFLQSPVSYIDLLLFPQHVLSLPISFMQVN